MKTRLRRYYPSAMLLIGLLGVVCKETSAHYMYPEIETVPTDRLIANLESRLADDPEESDQVRIGEEFKIWTWNRKSLDGTYTVGPDGSVMLPEFGKVEVAGRTIADLQAELTGDKKGVFVVQAWHQRKSRLLPGEKAELHYELGRVYSIAYAQGPTHFRALKGGDRPFLGHGASKGMPPDRRRFRSDGPVGRKQPIDPELAESHLQKAVEHFKTALKLKEDHLAGQLGLAWCLDQQGKREAAIEGYRQALTLAWAREKKYDCIVEVSWVEEIAGYLEKLLDPESDAEEIKKIQDYKTAIRQKGRAITPIIVAMDDDVGLKDLVDRAAAVKFDLDGSGLNRRWEWISPRAAWLVYDPERTGRITSGLQLFGNVTFWVFWKNGYHALGSLDNDGNGSLTGVELDGLALWRDVDTDGMSDPNEVIPLAYAGITSLSCEWMEHESGIPYNPKGAVWGDGRLRPTYDWRAHQVKADEMWHPPVHLMPEPAFRR